MTDNPTRIRGIDPVTRILREVLGAPPTADGQRQRPCLLGPTGTGKTSRVDALARDAGRPVFRLLLGTELPEDVLGLPRTTTRAGQHRVDWHLREGFLRAAKEPCVLFLDELDKARPELWSTCLTLLAEGRVRDLTLHPDTWIVAAMQPVTPGEFLADETGRALAARLVFVPVAADWRFVEQRVGLSGVAELLGGLDPVEPVKAPILSRPSPRQVEWACRYLRTGPDPEVAQAVLSGVMPEGIAKGVRELVAGEGGIDLGAVIRTGRFPQALPKLTVPELIEASPHVWLHGVCEDFVTLLNRVDELGSDDDLRSLLEHTYTVLRGHADQNEGSVEVFPGQQDEHVAETFSKAIEALGERWKAKAEEPTP